MSTAAKEKGFVLIVTLWVMVVLGVMLTNLAYQVRVESNVQRWALNQSTLRLAARGAVHTAAARIREHAADDYHSPNDDWWSDETLFRNQTIGAARVSLLRPGGNAESADTEDADSDGADELPMNTAPQYGLDDEESRLNINVAMPNQLTGFSGISTVLAESIARFRRELQEQEDNRSDDSDTNSTSSESSSESTDSNEDEQGATELVQGPIRSLSELLQVEGVTEELLFEMREDEAPLATLLTTTSSGKVNVNSASEAVLSAVGFREGQVNSILAQRDETPFTSIESLEQAISDDPERWERISKFVDVRSSTFRMLAQATLPEQTRSHHTVATLFTGSSALTFIRWREY